ncbi:efflux transporter, hydrophobe/amphiphile efflux-3 (HAE3) family [Methanolacinia petrolearia DSM 11571]|uniref:Efflux transporter, hydrophobe/amphiphile efflux-3 (HAE3) family n=1 Tax=Methanolacinia petrolearia (strain DSM 11571 / OCM 486 / SEBR 4847) TaxID=679926 RepID=E1RGV8_METP4|nr:hydrophobe/amphiphile efflux-3 (HAE3) family transporter [Methanolacinia petrolearia]ADN37487.1 efflux transporter, hydrophobe/amphiphile efflux-3 (HAE3) family [Methanolacinia petrolearia DSM 11571]
MKSPFEIIANVINRHTLIVAGLVVGVMLFALYGASMTTMKTGTDTYLYTDEPVGSLLIHYEEEFGSDSVILIIEGSDVTSPAVVNYLEELEADIADERYIASVTGLPDLIKSVNNGVIPQSQAEIDACISLLPEEYSEMVLPSGTMTLMSVPLETGYPEDAEESIVNTINSIIESSNPPPGISVSASGSPAFSVEMKEDMQKNMGTLIGLAMLLMIVAMALLFGHVRYRMLPVLIVFCGIILTFGVMGLAGIALTSIVIAAFPVLIGIGIDYAIQFQSRFDEERRRSSITDAVKTTITSSGPAILLAMIATALGFAALSLLAPSPMVSDFGTICIVGIACCYLCAMIIVPTFAKLVNYTPKNTGSSSDNSESCVLEWKECNEAGKAHKSSKNVSFMERYDELLGRLAEKIARHPGPILIIFLMVAIVGFQLDSKVIIDTDEDSMVDQNMPALITMNKVTSVMGSTSTITAYVKADSILDYNTLKWMDDFGEYAVSKHDDLTGATSIATYIKSYNNGVIPSDKKTLEDVWESIPESTKESYVSGKTEAVIEFSMEDISIPATQELIADMEADLNWYTMHPGMDVTFTGQMYMFSDLINGIKDTKNPMTYLGFVLIFIFLLLVYRKYTAISPLVPIVMIVGWNGLIMYSLGLTYSLLTATLGAMTIGVASEYTILIMERFEEEREKGVGTYVAIQTAIQKIGTAISVSGLTTVFGFSALLLATSPIIQNFGTVTVITVGFSLVGAIVVMPAVITILERFRPKEA